MDGDSGLQHGQHRRLFGGDLPSIKPTAITKSLYIVVGSRCAAPQSNGSGIEPNDPALDVTSVDRHRKLFDEIGTHLKSGRGAATLCYSAHFSTGRIIRAHLALHSLLGARLGRRSTANGRKYVLVVEGGHSYVEAIYAHPGAKFRQTAQGTQRLFRSAAMQAFTNFAA
jgi:hypothetical protein